MIAADISDLINHFIFIQYLLETNYHISKIQNLKHILVLQYLILQYMQICLGLNIKGMS